MALITLVPPTSEPVTLAQMKQFARVDFPDDDTLWPTLIAGARQWAEIFMQRRIMMQTMRLYMDFFPGYIDFKMAGQKVSSPFVSGSNAVLVGIRYAILLPYPRVRSLVQFLYQDANGDTQTMIAGTDYIQDLESQPARLTPLFGQMWPVARVIVNAIQIDYITGWGANYANAGMAAGSAAITGVTFDPSLVGQAIVIPNAGANGQNLSTTLATVDGSGNGTASAAAQTTVAGQTLYMGDPVPESVQIAIMRLALWNYENRNSTPDLNFLETVKRQLSPYRDLRL